MPEEYYDVIVIGGGHAACEAAYASARLGASTLMLTINLDHIAQMSCNPCIGGIAKGHLVREIDALGGAMGQIADASSIQFRMLNRTKGPAVWSPRSQCDKVAYQRSMKRLLELTPNLTIKQSQVTSFLLDGDAVCGVETEFGDLYKSKSVVVATGTFLAGKMHFGLRSFPGGRAGDHGGGALVKTKLYRMQTLCNAVRAKPLGQTGKKLPGNGRVHKAHLLGVADAGAAGFCVLDDVQCFGKVGSVVYIDMADAGAGLDTGHLGVLHAGTDEPCTAAGDQQIHIAYGGHQSVGRGMGGVLDQAD